MADSSNTMSQASDVETVAAMAVRQWPVLVKLRKPVEFGSETVTSLEFRRGRLGDLKGVTVDKVPPLDQLMLVASRLCGKPLKVIELLEDDDGAEVIELALDFFARCLGGGKTPQPS